MPTSTTDPPTPKALSPIKWVLGVVVFIAVIGSIMLGALLSPRGNRPRRPEPIAS